MEKCLHELVYAQFYFTRPEFMPMEVVFMVEKKFWNVFIHRIGSGKLKTVANYTTASEPSRDIAEFFLNQWLDEQQSPNDGA